jgi:predicted Zn-dependent peptidase
MTVCTVLANGVRILSRGLPGRRAAAVGLWLRGGVRGQRPGEDGYAHLLEHLLCRGEAWARGLDVCGGYLNAATTRELTVLHGLAGGAARAASLAALLGARLLRPDLSADGLREESSAVQNELADAGNDLSASMEDELVRLVWRDHPMARSILGDARSVAGCDAAALARFHRRAAHGRGVCVVATGDVEHDALVESCLPLGSLPAMAGDGEGGTPPRFSGHELRRRLAGERSAIGWLMPVPGFGHAGGAACALAEQVAARSLRAELRGRLGLVYDVESRLDIHSDCGLWWLRIACDAREAARCRDVVEALFERLVAALREDEVLRAFHQLRARWLIEEDDLEHTMERIAREALFIGRVRSLDQRLAALTAADAGQVALALGRCWRQRAHFDYGPDAGRRAARGDMAVGGTRS